jgi:hypothetical protein
MVALVRIRLSQTVAVLLIKKNPQMKLISISMWITVLMSKMKAKKTREVPFPLC